MNLSFKSKLFNNIRWRVFSLVLPGDPVLTYQLEAAVFALCRHITNSP
jgi:hypothetical protein